MHFPKRIQGLFIEEAIVKVNQLIGELEERKFECMIISHIKYQMIWMETHEELFFRKHNAPLNSMKIGSCVRVITFLN